MAGPGGGAPRRSHTKSRKGCDSCKRRHIRCDEGFPQCHNCTKHKVRCPYNDVNTAPDLAWTPEIEAAIDAWIETGVFPFPNMGVDPAPDPKAFTKEELRLMYHVAALYDKLAATDTVQYSIWAREIPKILRIGSKHRFVMHGLLALSASHMSHQTGDAAIGKTMLDQSGMAMSGFQSAMTAISPDSADALLAASNVLSWQVTTWREWTGHNTGSSAITEEIHNNKWHTQFDDIVADSINFPTSPPSPTPDRKIRQASPSDLEALNMAQTYLVKLEAHLKQKKASPKLVSQLLGFVKAVRKVPTYRSPEEQFERLRSLREWLMWLPVDQLEQNGLKADLLVTVAHYYAVALIVERLFPEMASVYCASLLIKPISRIFETLRSMERHAAPGEVRGHVELMNFPLQTAHEFQARMGCPVVTPYMPSPALSCYEAVPVASFYDSPTFSYSTEDLSSIKQESAPNSAISPLSTSSHFMPGPHGTQPHLLNIPSPSYPGAAAAYSPASSTFEGSLAYSDAEDNGGFDLRSLSGSPTAVYETLNSYDTPGVFDGLEWEGFHHQTGFDKLPAHEDFYFTGFVSPLQTVWTVN
jgi:hypothetical protein